MKPEFFVVQIDAKDKWNWSLGFPDRDEAEKVALEGFMKNGLRCFVVETVMRLEKKA